MPGVQPTSFLSYARAQESLARRLYNDLSAGGVHAWMDRYDIPPGAVWDDAIQQGLEACSHVIVLVSQAAIDSRSVHAEWNYADARGKMLLPLICEPLEYQQIPFRLHTAHWIRLTDAEYDAVLANLLQVLPLSTAPNPLAAPDTDVPTGPAERADPAAAAAAWKRGNVAYHAGDLTAAVQAYSDAIQLAPDRAEAYIHRGMVRYSLKEYAQALADFGEAERRDPDIPLLYNNRGVTHLALNHITAALADLDEALLLDPDYTTAHYNQAAVFIKMGR
ncbi:MAG: TIR domain-containing protein [Chloroflexi bacterium]|nr:MAG: TIR domain-containing protein [Chloroflexota bacterium]